MCNLVNLQIEKRMFSFEVICKTVLRLLDIHKVNSKVHIPTFSAENKQQKIKEVVSQFTSILNKSGRFHEPALILKLSALGKKCV